MSLQSCHWRFKNYMDTCVRHQNHYSNNRFLFNKSVTQKESVISIPCFDNSIGRNGSWAPKIQLSKKKKIYIIWELEVTLVRLYQSCDISSSRSFAISHPSPDLICQSSATSQPNKVSPVKICWLLSF